MYKSQFNKGPFNIKYEPCIPIHFQPPKEQPLEQLKSLKKIFFSGPFKPNNDECKPIHFQPPKETPPSIKIKKRWNPAGVKSKILFNFEMLNNNII